MGVMGVMGRKHKNKTSPVQRDSEISILKTSPYRPYRPLAFKTTPAQRHSKMSNKRMSGVSCWPHGQNAPAQRYSGIYILGMGLIGTMRLIGLMGQKPVMENRPAQWDSKISILKNCPLCPYCLSCPLASKIAPAERGSKIAILGLENIVKQSAQRTQRRESL